MGRVRRRVFEWNSYLTRTYNNISARVGKLFTNLPAHFLSGIILMNKCSILFHSPACCWMLSDRCWMWLDGPFVSPAWSEGWVLYAQSARSLCGLQWYNATEYTTCCWLSFEAPNCSSTGGFLLSEENTDRYWWVVLLYPSSEFFLWQLKANTRNLLFRGNYLCSLQ